MAIVANSIRARYVSSMVLEQCSAPVTHLVQGDRQQLPFTPGAMAPHTIFGSKPCPKSFHRSGGSADAVHTCYRSRLGRNVTTKADRDVQSESLDVPN